MSLEMSMQTTLELIKMNIRLGVQDIPEKRKSFNDLLNSYLYYRIWEKLGRNTFVFSDRLIDGLRNTDVSENFCFEDLHLPFDSFILNSSSGFVGSEVINNTSEFVFEDDFKYIFFVRSEHIKAWSNLIMKDVLSIEPNILGDFHIMFLAENKQHKNVYDYFFIPVCKSNTIKELCKYSNLFPGIRQILNVAVNSVLYINDPTNRDNREFRDMSMLYYPDKKGKKRFEKFRAAYLYPPKDFLTNFKGVHKGPISSRFWVRGHWRQQPYGIERKQKKHIWIKPYVKGKGKEKEREYRVF